jgi:hypothetical protein
MFIYQVWEAGNYLGRVEHRNELHRNQCLKLHGTIYRILYGDGRRLQVTESPDGFCEAEIDPHG